VVVPNHTKAKPTTIVDVFNAIMEHLEKFEELTMRFSMRNMVDSSASIRTDNYVCYRKMKEAIPTIETVESKNVVGFN
jgi:hypothetical protein